MNQKKNLIRKTIMYIMTLMASVATIYPCKSQSFSQGQGFPSAITEESYGCMTCTGSTWTNMSNVSSPDNQFSETQLNQNPFCFQGTCFYSRALEVSNFGFSIPATSTIVGIEAEVLRKASFPQSAVDSIVHLMSGSNQVGSNKASGNFWPLNPAYEVYGGATDLWGSSWTPSMVNSNDFGLYYKPVNDNTNVSGFTVSVDHVRMTVYYSDPTGVVENQVSDNMFSAYYNHAERQINIRTFRMKSENATANIFNSMGQLVVNKYLASSSADVALDKIDAAGLQEGIYFLELNSGGMSFSKKIFVSK